MQVYLENYSSYKKIIKLGWNKLTISSFFSKNKFFFKKSLHFTKSSCSAACMQRENKHIHIY